MRTIECNKFSELLEQRRKDFPQVIVAGWMLPVGMLPVGMPVAAVTVACDVHPKTGELAVATAACLAAALKKIDQLCADNPTMRETIMGLVVSLVGDLEVVKRFQNDLLGPGVLASAKHAAAAGSVI